MSICEPLLGNPINYLINNWDKKESGSIKNTNGIVCSKQRQSLIFVIIT